MAGEACAVSPVGSEPVDAKTEMNSADDDERYRSKDARRANQGGDSEQAAEEDNEANDYQAEPPRIA
jgi:hypothetical protein